LRDGYQGIKDAGAAELITISGDTQFGASNTRNDLGLTFPVLSDSDFEAIEAYNVLDQGSMNWANPSAFIINEEGIIVWTDIGRRFGHRTTSTQIITALQGL